MASANATLPAMDLPTMAKYWENAARPWPESHGRRWALRLGLAAPFVGLAVLADARGWQNPTTVGLHDYAEQMLAGGWSLSGLQYGYPPMAVVVALLPDATLTYGIAAALAFGWLLQLVLWQNHRRDISPVLMVPLLAFWLGVPAVWYEASQRFDTIMSLALLTMAMAGWLRFTNADHTDGGIKAGIALAVCMCFSPIALVFAVMFALTLPFYLMGRKRSFRALPAMLAVLLFPITVVTGWWVYLVWLFVGNLGTAWYLMSSSFANFSGEGVAGALKLMGEAWVYTPVYTAVAVAVAIATRSLVTVLVYLVPLVAVGLGSLAHLPFMSLSLAYLLLCLVAITTMPKHVGTRTQVAVAAVALVQLEVMLLHPFHSGYFPDWAAALGWS